MRRRALLAASAASGGSGGGELADFYLTLNTTNSENLKVYEFFEKNCSSDGFSRDWVPTNINVYVNGQAGNATFSNARVTWANSYVNDIIWFVFFEGMEDIGLNPICILHNNGTLEAFDDD